jgi:Calcineurin-like phosphoesterase
LNHFKAAFILGLTIVHKIHVNMRAIAFLCVAGCVATAVLARDAGSLLAIPVPGTGTLKPLPQGKFTFVVAGDSRPASATLPPPPTASMIFSAAKSAGASFAIWTGDTVFGSSTDPSVMQAQYQQFTAVATTGGVPVFNTPGNHEMCVVVQNGQTYEEVGSEQMQAIYRANMGIPAGAPTYGAFSYANARFILVDTEERPPAGTIRSPSPTAGSKVLDVGYVSSKQLKWLSSELKANKATHTFLFMHHPIIPSTPEMGLNKRNAEELIKLFKKHSNIDYVFASHEHLYYNVQTKDASPPPSRTAPSRTPPFYLISGGAGAPLTQGVGGFYNYLLVTVDGNSVSVQLIQL